MNNIYSLIIYTPNEGCGYDRCGTHYDGDNSNFEKNYFVDEQEATQAFALACVNHHQFEHITFLINGVEVFPNISDCEHLLTEEELLVLKNIFERIDTNAFCLREVFEEQKRKKEKEDELKKQKQEALKKRQEQLHFEAQERKQLQQLINKYGQ